MRTRIARAMGFCALILLLLVWVGSSLTESLAASAVDAPSAPKFSQAERAALRQMLEDTDCDPDEVTAIDLTKPSNELGYRALMRESGAKPWVYAQIDQAKAIQLQLRAQGKPLPRLQDRMMEKSRALAAKKNASPQQSLVLLPKDYFSVLGITGTSDWTKTRAVMYSSLFYEKGAGANNATDGNAAARTTIIQDSLTLYDILGDVVGWQNGEIRDAAVTNILSGTQSASPVNNPGRGDVAAYATLQGTVNGDPIMPMATCTKKQNAAAAVWLQRTMWDPSHQKTSQQSPAVIVCLNRSNPAPGWPDLCDYGPTQPNVANENLKVTFPVNGVIVTNTSYQLLHSEDPKTHEVHYLLDPSGKSWMVDMTISDGGDGQYATGGVCVPPRISEGFDDHMKAYGTGFRGVSWTYNGTSTYPYADFGPVCYRSGQNYIFTMMMTVGLADPKTGKFKGTAQTTFTNDPQMLSQCFVDSTATGGINCGTIVAVPMVQVQYGCIVAGTEITMADGRRRKKIEDLQPGDKVLSRSGRILQVSNLLTGTDSEIIELVDDKKHSVSVTSEHPVKTARGMLAAKQLKVGDTVYTDDGGEARLVKVKAHSGKVEKVYNLVLTGDGMASPYDAVFYAGSVLVGDNNVQGLLARGEPPKSK